MITIAHLEARASRPMPAPPGASPPLKPAHPDAGPPQSDRRPGSPLDQSSQTRRPAASTRSRVPLRRKRPAGTQGSGDIDKPSAVTERAPSLGDHTLSEIDAPGPHLTPACGGRTRRPRTEEWPLPDDHPRSGCQLGALDPRSPITEEGLVTASGSRADLTARPAPSEPYVQVSPHTAQASASAYEVDRGDGPGRHQRWTRARVISPVAGSRRTRMLVLPRCSRSGSKTASQAAHQPACCWSRWRRIARCPRIQASLSAPG